MKVISCRMNAAHNGPNYFSELGKQELEDDGLRQRF